MRTTFVLLLALLLTLSKSAAGVLSCQFTQVPATPTTAPILYKFPLTTDHSYMAEYHATNNLEYLNVYQRGAGLEQPTFLATFSAQPAAQAPNSAIQARFVSDAFRAYITTSNRLSKLSQAHQETIATQNQAQTHKLSKTSIILLCAILIGFIGYLFVRTRPISKS